MSRLLTIWMVLAMRSVDAINIIEILSNSLKKSKSGSKNMISMDLSKVEYDRNQYQDYIKPLSNDSNLALAQALDLSFTKSKDGLITLNQNGKDHIKVDNLMENTKNMGYEGTFWFGNPP